MVEIHHIFCDSYKLYYCRTCFQKGNVMDLLREVEVFVKDHLGYVELPVLEVSYQAHARSARARRACALRALGLLLADGTPTVGGGKTF